jgi:hypothetical protein
MGKSKTKNSRSFDRGWNANRSSSRISTFEILINHDVNISRWSMSYTVDDFVASISIGSARLHANWTAARKVFNYNSAIKPISMARSSRIIFEGYFYDILRCCMLRRNLLKSERK